MKFITFYKNSHGIAALSAILLFGSIIVEIAIVTAFIAFVMNNINYGARLSAEALFAAKAGIDDAILKLTRNKDFVFPSSPGYELPVGNRTAKVLVCKDFKTAVGASPCGAIPNVGKYEVTSVGQASNKQRQLRAIIDVDPTLGLARVVSKEEVPF